MALARAACLIAALLVCASAFGQVRTLYRWVDAQGRVQYSDKPPTGFKGEVTRVEVDVEANTSPAPAPAPRQPRIAPEVLRDVTPDVAKARRDKRAALEERLRKAEQKYAAAKGALDGGENVQEEERQVIQRNYAKVPSGRANCRTVVDAKGKTTYQCPMVVPKEEYYGRQASLEEALKQAEAELDEARAAYRRGVD